MTILFTVKYKMPMLKSAEQEKIYTSHVMQLADKIKRQAEEAFFESTVYQLVLLNPNQDQTTYSADFPDICVEGAVGEVDADSVRDSNKRLVPDFQSTCAKTIYVWAKERSLKILFISWWTLASHRPNVAIT